MTHAHTQLAATLVERVGALAAALEQTTRRDVDDDNDASACAVTTTTSTTTMTTAAQLMRTSVCFVREVWERLPRSDAHGTALATAACLPVWELMMQAQQQQRQQAGRPHRDAAALLLLPRVLTRLTLLYMYAKAHDRRCLYQQLSCSGAEPATTNATTAAAASGLPLYVPLPLRTECLRFAPSSSNSSSTALAAYVTALQFVRHTVQREMQLAAGGAAAAAQAVTRAVQSLVSDVLPACVLTVRARRTAATHANTTATTTTRPAVRDVVRIVLDDDNKGNADEHEYDDDDATSWRVFASMLWRYMVFAERYAADAAVLRRLVAFLTSSTWSQTTLELPCANAAAARALALSLRPSSSSSAAHSHRGSDDGGDNNNTDGRAAAAAASDVVCIRYADILTPLTDAFAVCLSVSPRVPSTAADNAPLIDAHVHARCLHGTATAHDMVATHDVLTTLATPHAAHVRSRNHNDNDDAATATTLPDMARHVADVHASLARVCDDVSWDGVSGVCRDADQLTLLLRGMLATPLARHHGSGRREVDDDKEACRNHASDDNNDDDSAATAVLRFDARAARELLFSRKRGRDTAALLPRTTTLAHFASHTPSGGSSSTADAASLTTLERLCTQWAARE